MKFKLIFLFFILSVGLNAQVNTRHFMLAGRIDLSEDRYVEAIRNFNTAISTKPDHFEAYFLRGVAKYSLGDFQGAIDDFTTTLKIHPLYARAYHYRGIANDRISNYHDAMADFNHALEIDPFNADLHVASGATRMHLNQFKAAIEAYNQALLINPTISYAYLNRGLAKRFQGDTLQAVEDLNKAVFYDYFDTDAWIRRGMIRYEINDTAGAMTDFNQAILLDYKNPLVYFQRALVYLKTGDTTRALNDYEHVNMLDQRNALTYYNRALIYSIRKQLEPAEVLYKEVIKINPQNVYAYFNLGVVHYQMKKMPEAVDDFTSAIELFPDFAGAWVNRSIAKKDQGDEKGSYSDYQKAMGIISAINTRGENADSLFAQYADSSYFNKIIELESDFVSGNMKSTRIQFQDVDIQPFPNFIIAVLREQKPGQSAPKGFYSELELSQLNQPNEAMLKLGYMLENFSSDPENQTVLDGLQLYDSLARNFGETNTADFYNATSQQLLQNYRKADAMYSELIQDKKTGAFALFNRAVLRFDREELVLSDVEYNNTITISKQKQLVNQSDVETREPDYSHALKDMNLYLKSHPDQAFAHYNRANVLLHMKDFQRAIDAYSDAIAHDPTLAEAFYNRALTLIYLGENGLACSDLSKAGELG
ncbi:MAG: tetratricopeptide repeat protein, partial [Bacteroidales bacterium]